MHCENSQPQKSPRGRFNQCFINNAEVHWELIKEPSRHIISTTRIFDKDESFLIFHFSIPHHDGTVFLTSLFIYLFILIPHRESLACTLRETSCGACATKSNSTKAELALKFFLLLMAELDHLFLGQCCLWIQQ